MSQTPALESEGVTKTYGHFPALRGVSLRVAAGSSVTLFGRNGAGKTTFLKIAAMLARASTGRVRILGHDIESEPEAARRRLGFLSHSTSVYRDLSTMENLRFFARLYRTDGGDDYLRRVIGRVGLEARRNDPIRSLSRGLQQRAGLARVMLHRPDLLLLDEPYTGLDAEAVATLNLLLDEAVAEGRTVILTTHDLEQGLRAATDAHIIERGRIVHSSAGDGAGLREAYARYVRREKVR